MNDKAQQAKDTYRLWWEYLKEVPDYEVFCKHMDEGYATPDELKKWIRYFELFGNLHAVDFEKWWKCHTRIKKNDPAIIDLREDCHHRFDSEPDSPG